MGRSRARFSSDGTNFLRDVNPALLFKKADLANACILIAAITKCPWIPVTLKILIQPLTCSDLSASTLTVHVNPSKYGFRAKLIEKQPFKHLNFYTNSIPVIENSYPVIENSYHRCLLRESLIEWRCGYPNTYGIPH